MSEEAKPRKPAGAGAPRAPRTKASGSAKPAAPQPRKAKARVGAAPAPVSDAAPAAVSADAASPSTPASQGPVPAATPVTATPVTATAVATTAVAGAPEPVGATPEAVPAIPPPPNASMLAASLPKVGRSYSRFVSLMKVALPIAALGLIAAVVAWPGGDVSRPGALPISFANVKIDPTGLSMKSPRYVGVDKQGQAYTVTAEDAIQDKADAERVDLTNPEADISLRSGAWFHLQSKTGVIHPKSNTIDLDGSVELYSADGWEGHASAVSANLDEGTARSDLPITGQGPAGTISADRFEAWDGGNHIRFIGNVRMTVMPSARS